MTRRRRLGWALGALLAYALLAAVYTQPLLFRAGVALASDPGDPALNTAILLWNASVVPFSAAWWNAPHYYPTPGVAAFTETLVGIGPLFDPLLWISGNPVLAYNIALFLTWPLSAWAAYLLVWRLTRRRDASLLAGLAFGFSPYRLTEIAHIQMLSAEWLPLMLLGLHEYLENRRLRWLGLFGAAWLLNALTNGHLMLFGGVFVFLWLTYFCSARRSRGAVLPILGAWAAASLPLVPMLLRYREVHEQFGLIRTEAEILAYSARPSSWAHVTGDVWFWRNLLPDAHGDLFPGVTALVVVLAGSIVLLWRGRHAAAPASPWRRRTWWTLAGATALAAIATAVTLGSGPWSVTVGQAVLLRVANLNRAVLMLGIAGGALVWMTRSTREALLRRSPLVFYTGGIGASAIFCLGPVLRVGESVLLSPMPYRWLMALPGFRELRMPPRFWMLGVLCLGAAAGLAFSHLRMARPRLAKAVWALVAAGLLVDGWIPAMRMAAPPEVWAAVESPASSTPLLELPIGTDDDWGATFRAGIHLRRVVNGVSGYNPPYYTGLAAGLQQRDERTLAAIASFGPIEVVVNRAADSDGAIVRFVSGYPGAARTRDDGRRVAYLIPKGPAEPVLGPALPIASVHANRNDGDAAFTHDGRLETGWGDYPQEPDARVTIDLGSVREVGGLTHTIGDFFLDFPRRLVIEVSADGSAWDTVWEGAPTGPLVLASVRAPRVADMRFSFAPHRARFVRLRQLERFRTMWRISELAVHAPAAR